MQLMYVYVPTISPVRIKDFVYELDREDVDSGNMPIGNGAWRLNRTENLNCLATYTYRPDTLLSQTECHEIFFFLNKKK
jgi:hypothetical protein